MTQSAMQEAIRFGIENRQTFITVAFVAAGGFLGFLSGMAGASGAKDPTGPMPTGENLNNMIIRLQEVGTTPEDYVGLMFPGSSRGETRTGNWCKTKNVVFSTLAGAVIGGSTGGALSVM